MENRKPLPRSLRGFSLADILVSLGVLGIMLGTVAPLIFKASANVEITETRAEMRLLERGLLRYYRDYGRFPSDDEGVAGLINGQGVSWSGPYVSGKIREVTRDVWGEAYLYENLASGSNAVNSIDLRADSLMLASMGPNQVLEPTTRSPTQWYRATDDDLLLLVSSYLTKRQYVKDTVARISGVMDISAALAEEACVDGNLITEEPTDVSCRTQPDYVQTYNRLTNNTGYSDLKKSSGQLLGPGVQSECALAWNDDTTATNHYKKCPIIALEARDDRVLLMYSTDQWGSRLFWHTDHGEFYSIGPNRIDENGLGDDIFGRY